MSAKDDEITKKQNDAIFAINDVVDYLTGYFNFLEKRIEAIDVRLSLLELRKKNDK